MIHRIKQMLWRQRRLVVMLPEHDAVRVGVYLDGYPIPSQIVSELYTLDTAVAPRNGVKNAEQWAAFVDQHRENSWVIVLPHALTISQSITCEATTPDLIDQDLQKQAKKLSGLGQRKVILDHELLPSHQSDRSTYWVTYCQDDEIQQIIREHGIENVAICDVIGSHDACWSGIQHLRRPKGNWMLVEVLDGGTSLVVFEDHTPLLSHFYPMGHALAKERGQSAKGTYRLGEGSSSTTPKLSPLSSGIQSIGEAWAREMERTILEHGNREGRVSSSVEQQLPCLLICEPGSRSDWASQLQLHLGSSVLPFENWIHETSIGWKSKNLRQDGACMATCKKSISLPSLLPEEVKLAWDQKQVDLAFRSAALVACFLITVMLVVAFIQKSVLWDLKSDLLEQLDSVEARVGKSLEVFDSLKEEYQMLRPLLMAEDQTVAVLKTLETLQSLSREDPGWMVLLADIDSYYSIGDQIQARALAEDTNSVPSSTTNRIVMDRGLVLEMVLDSKGEAMRRRLEETVTFFRQSDFILRADTLPGNARRSIVSSNVILSDRHFAISLELPSVSDQVQAPTSNSRQEEPSWKRVQPAAVSTNTISAGGS